MTINNIVKLHFFFYNLLYSGALFRQTKCVIIMIEEGSNKIVNFMTPGVGVLVLRCDHIIYIVKMHYFFKNLFLNSQALIRKTKYKVMITK